MTYYGLGKLPFINNTGFKLEYCNHQQCGCLINDYYNKNNYHFVKYFELCDDIKNAILLKYIDVCRIYLKDYILDIK